METLGINGPAVFARIASVAWSCRSLAQSSTPAIVRWRIERCEWRGVSAAACLKKKLTGSAKRRQRADSAGRGGEAYERRESVRERRSEEALLRGIRLTSRRHLVVGNESGYCFVVARGGPAGEVQVDEHLEG